MDSRLFEIRRRRPHRLRRQDLPEVAKAIVAVVRKQARARPGGYKNLAYVHLKGEGIDVIVLREDWSLIFPFIEDGSFSPLLRPAEARVGYLDPVIHFDGPAIDIGDRAFYQRVLGILQGLFTEEYPTSDL